MKTRTPNRIVWVALLTLSGCDRIANRESTAANGTGGIEVEVVGPGIVSTELPEFASAFSPDGDTIYFNRTPSDRSSIGLFYSIRTD
ncbi:MAG: PD40 domain-containing protein [Bacteroidetes bacterium]|nr:PD40 domain-containing protein [Bacteroidota bacterium]